MKIDGVLCQLDEARKHLSDLIDDIHRGEIGEDGDVELQGSIEHILDHLCAAWNARDISVVDYGEVSQAEFERYCHTVPDIFGVRTLQ